MGELYQDFYTYVWKVEGDDRLYCETVYGDWKEHDLFIERIKQLSNLVYFGRYYDYSVNIILHEKYYNLLEEED